MAGDNLNYNLSFTQGVDYASHLGVSPHSFWDLPTRFSDLPMALLRIYILWYLSAHCCTQYICQIIHSKPVPALFFYRYLWPSNRWTNGLGITPGLFMAFQDFFFEILMFFKDEEYVCSKSLRTLSLLLQASILKVHNTYFWNHHKALKFLTTQYVTYN